VTRANRHGIRRLDAPTPDVDWPRRARLTQTVAPRPEPEPTAAELDSRPPAKPPWMDAETFALLLEMRRTL
jgi:hypothetical protein